jgi:serine/threonine protein kinase/Leucine-rich repeat (LRR) protein
MLKFNAKQKVSPQRRAAEELLQSLKPTIETETGRGNITINHFLQARQTQNEADFYPSDQPGTGFYTVENVVATGGMGAILQAFDNNLQRTVALKVMLNSLDAPESAIYSFVAEAQITGQLEHPNIVPLHDIGVTADGTIYYTMKLISGRTLREILREIRDGNAETIERFPLSRLLTIFQKICDGIAYAHSMNVVHRDLKPDNIMVGEFGEVLILDWGLAKVLSADGDAHEAATEGSEFDGGLPTDGTFGTLDGQVKGTPNYMAPEQAEGRVSDIDNRTDIYALGGIMYATLTLHPPITGANLDEILTRVTSSQIIPPLDYNRAAVENPTGLPAPHCPEGKIPSALSAVAMKCMAYDMDSRYMFVEALQGDIALYQGGYATGAEDAGFFKQLKLLLTRNKKEVFFAILVLAAIVFTALSFIGAVQLKAREAAKAQELAEAKIEELRKSAPAFLDVGQTLINEGDFEGAIERLNYAIELDDEDSRFYKARGDAYQAMMKIPQAYAEYKEASDREAKGITGSALAQFKKDLSASQSVCGAVGGTKDKELTDDDLRSLMLSMRNQNRSSAAFAIGKVLAKRDLKLLDETRVALFERAGLVGTLVRDDVDGLFHLDLTATAGGSIAALNSMLLKTLDLSGCTNVADISPLKDAPIVELNLSGTDVNDLSVIKTLKSLTKLDLSNCKLLTDLSPLQGITNITWLNISGSSVDSLDTIAQMPLRHLDISNTSLRDLKALTSTKSLQWLNLDNSRVTDIEALEGHPIAYFSAENTKIRKIDALKTAAPLTESLNLARTFVRDLSPIQGKRIPQINFFKCRMDDISALANMPLSFLDLREAPVSDISVLEGMPLDTALLRDTKISDIQPLKGAPLRDELDISGTKVTDLSPIAGAPLKSLHLTRCPIASLQPIAGMPLRVLRVDQTPTDPDLNPVWECQELEYLAVTFPGRFIRSLRQLPNIKKMTYSLPNDDWEKDAKSKAAFWRDFDARN